MFTDDYRSRAALVGKAKSDLLINRICSLSALIVNWITTSGLENYRGCAWHEEGSRPPPTPESDHNMTTNQSHATSSAFIWNEN